MPACTVKAIVPWELQLTHTHYAGLTGSSSVYRREVTAAKVPSLGWFSSLVALSCFLMYLRCLNSKPWRQRIWPISLILSLIISQEISQDISGNNISGKERWWKLDHRSFIDKSPRQLTTFWPVLCTTVKKIQTEQVQTISIHLSVKVELKRRIYALKGCFGAKWKLLGETHRIKEEQIFKEMNTGWCACLSHVC